MVLNLCNNRLTSLTTEIGQLTNLHILNLGLNQLKALPGSIGNLKELRHLGLFDNRFTSVPSCLGRLKKLERVNLDRNPLMTEQATGHKVSAAAESFYMVKKSALCEKCLDNYRTDRAKLENTEDYWD